MPHLGGRSRGEHFGRGVDKVDNHLLVRLPLLIPRESNPPPAKNAVPQQVQVTFQNTDDPIKGEKRRGGTQLRAGTDLDVVFVFIAIVAEDALWVEVHGAGFRARGQVSGTGRF